MSILLFIKIICNFIYNLGALVQKPIHFSPKEMSLFNKQKRLPKKVGKQLYINIENVGFCFRFGFVLNF